MILKAAPAMARKVVGPISPETGRVGTAVGPIGGGVGVAIGPPAIGVTPAAATMIEAVQAVLQAPSLSLTMALAPIFPTLV